MDSWIQADVVIVGYGPTSQVLALLLGRAGHRVAVVERWPDLYPLPRAVHFDDEIARILQRAGVIDDVNRIVEPAERYEWRNATGDVLIDFDWRGVGPSGWPVSNMFSQPDLERVLDSHVKALPTVQVYQGWSATVLRQDGQGVELEMASGASADGQWMPSGQHRRLRARYLVGADGANSMVRQSLGIASHDLGFAFDWLVVDVKPTTPREWHPKTWQLCDPARPTTVVPGGPGRRRWEFMLLPGETSQQMNQPAMSWALLAPWDVTPANATLERHAVYTFRGRWADEWRVGRVLLAGDAAHLMPPFAGQGLCSGLRDAMALSWRLDAVLSGRLATTVLDSYGPERSAHVQQMIGFSVALGKVICISSPEEAAQRDRDMLAARNDPAFEPPASPRPRLGAGCYLAETAGSGLLTPQGRVAAQGRTGRFDDVMGAGFALIARDADVLAQLSAGNRAALLAAGSVVTHLGPGGIDDLDGTYGRYLEAMNAVAVLVRPDFYSHGTAAHGADLDALVGAWRAQIGVAA